MDGPLDEPRVGAPRTVSDARVEEVVTRTLEDALAIGRAKQENKEGYASRLRGRLAAHKAHAAQKK